MSSVDQAEAAARVPSDAEYEHAERVIRRIQNAAADPGYYLALLLAHIELGLTAALPNIVRAVTATRANAGEPVTA